MILFLTFAVDISGIVSLYVYFTSPLFVPLVPITAVNFFDVLFKIEEIGLSEVLSFALDPDLAVTF